MRILLGKKGAKGGIIYIDAAFISTSLRKSFVPTTYTPLMFEVETAVKTSSSAVV